MGRSAFAALHAESAHGLQLKHWICRNPRIRRASEDNPEMHHHDRAPLTAPNREATLCRRTGPRGDEAIQLAGAGLWRCSRMADKPPLELASNPPPAFKAIAVQGRDPTDRLEASCMGPQHGLPTLRRYRSDAHRRWPRRRARSDR